MKINRPRVLIVKYEFETRWMSCVKLHAGLIEAYKAIADVDFCLFKNSVSDARFLSEALKARPYDGIVSVDHRLSPSKLAHYLVGNPELTGIRENLKVIFHSFGSIQVFKNDWLTFDRIARDLNLILAFPCESQITTYSRTLNDPGCLRLVPCPFDNCRLESLKNSYKVPVNKKIKIGYTGRISRLKNISALIRLFRPQLEKNEIELHLAGPFDDHDTPDITLGTGFYLREIQGLMAQVPNVHYAGVFPDEKDVYKFVSSLNGFCTLSTNPAEDFCLGVVEALTLGKPCLVTDWMALSDHAKRDEKVVALTFSRKPNGELDEASLSREDVSRFLELCQKSFPFRPLIPLESVSASLREILSQPFSPFRGFNEHLRNA